MGPRVHAQEQEVLPGMCWDNQEVLGPLAHIVADTKALVGMFGLFRLIEYVWRHLALGGCVEGQYSVGKMSIL